MLTLRCRIFMWFRPFSLDGASYFYFIYDSLILSVFNNFEQIIFLLLKKHSMVKLLYLLIVIVFFIFNLFHTHRIVISHSTFPFVLEIPVLPCNFIVQNCWTVSPIPYFGNSCIAGPYLNSLRRTPTGGATCHAVDVDVVSCAMTVV